MTIRSEPAPTPSISPAQKYKERLEIFDAQGQRLKNQANWVAHGRVATFLAAGASWSLLIYGAGPASLWIFLAVILPCVFLGLVVWHGILTKGVTRSSELATINRHALARIQRAWDQFPVPKVEMLPGSEIVARDLDIFGRASLYHLICRARTSLSRLVLRDWLVDPAEPEVILRRQAAMNELVPALDLRQELEYRGQQATRGHVDTGLFVTWAESPSPWAGRGWLLHAARGLPCVTLLLFLLGKAAIIPASLWLVPFMLGILISFAFCRQIHSTFNQIGSRHDEIKCYSDLFRLATQMPGSSVELQGLHRQLPSGPDSPCRRLRLLGRIIDLANFRYSPMVYMAVQPLLLWDFHVLGFVLSWQRRSGGHVRGWFEALAELEALASLAALTYDHPKWTMPEVILAEGSTISKGEQTTGSILNAKGLGHPLLPDDHRVPCDVTVGPSGTFLLVTGSNMSGKSTLLRALGTNVILAQAGGPVCAARLQLPPLRIATSMRIDDSLEQGVSFFMAELKRLKQIVELAAQTQMDQSSNPNARTLLYLLDEILLGTNSVERHIAVQRVLSRLLDQGAIGAISTHDLDLAKDAVLEEASHPVHYQESFHTENGIQKMTFDYKLHPGVTTTTNALKLLEIVGL